MNPKSTTKRVFVCSNCGAKEPRWAGKCNVCGNWDTFVEQTVSATKQGGSRAIPSGEIVDLSALKTGGVERFSSGLDELDAVLGGGIVPGSLVLLGGDPGIGKSTLALQSSLAAGDVLYCSGEESAGQIKLRSERIAPGAKLSVLAETDLNVILATVEAQQPRLVVLDSVQTLYAEQFSGVSGGVAQVTGAVQEVMRLAKRIGVAFLIIGHVTKEGTIAGPKTLEHMVDTVLYLEGDRFGNFRILRCVKNRFGSTSEVGVFEMEGSGLRQVLNPSELFLSASGEQASGNLVAAVVEGSRPLLLEVQALTSAAAYGYPRRTAAGFDPNRLQLLTAILAKRGGVNLSQHDLYVNIVGGLKVTEPAVDLAIALAAVSSVKDQIVTGTVAIGELGLSGEVRSVPQIEARLKEVGRLGFTRCLVPRLKSVPKIKNLDLVQVRNLGEAIKAL